MNLFNDVGNFFSKEIPKFFVKTIPDAVSSIPNPGDRATWEPELPGLRSREKKMVAELEGTREAFLASKEKLAMVQAEYRAVLEDYGNRLGDAAAAARLGRVKGGQWDDPASDADVIVRGIGNTLRDVVGFVTLDLTEIIFAPGEAKKEKEFLRQRIAALGAAQRKIAGADRQLLQAVATLRHEIEDARAEMRAHGLADGQDGASERVLRQAADAADLAIARRMRADGLSPERIALLTNLDLAAIKALPDPDNGKVEPPSAEDQAGELLEESVPTLYVCALTGVPPEQLVQIAERRGLRPCDAEDQGPATEGDDR